MKLTRYVYAIGYLTLFKFKPASLSGLYTGINVAPTKYFSTELFAKHFVIGKASSKQKQEIFVGSLLYVLRLVQVSNAVKINVEYLRCFSV